MTELVRFETTNGASIIVEVDDDSYGLEAVSRNGHGIIEASKKVDEAIAQTRPAIEAILDTVKEMAPNAWEVEFGVKLNGEVGAVIAKAAVEGHFVVRLSWGGDAK